MEKEFTMKDMLLLVIIAFVLIIASYFIGLHEGLCTGYQKANIEHIENTLNIQK